MAADWTWENREILAPMACELGLSSLEGRVGRLGLSTVSWSHWNGPMVDRNGNAFPTTQMTWIGQRLGLGQAGRLDVNHHVMDVYAWPLQVYFRGCRDRWLGEPEEIVQGFFADRLARDGFFAGWQQSGLRLNHWLRNAFCFYLHELRRRRRREQSEDALPPSSELSDGTAGPEEEVDRAFAVSLVRAALERTERRCRDEQREAHFEVFVRHYYHGQRYDDFASELGISPARGAVMARTAARRFRDALRELVKRDGTSPAEIDSAIAALLEVTGS